MVSREGHIPVTGGKVWFQVVGEEATKPPVIVKHGGPGADHRLLKSTLVALAEERQVIFYYQLGSTNSKPDDSSDLSF